MRNHLQRIAPIAVCLAAWGCAGSIDDLGGADPGSADAMADESAELNGNNYSQMVTVGYQGWFNAEGDGSPLGWRHWSPGSPPGAANLTFELYPDTREYADADLFSTSFAALRDGRPARLFSSQRPNVVDTHFRWMEQYGIDGVALQRFVVALYNPADVQGVNAVLASVRTAAEAHGRSFHIEYDLSGANPDTWVEDVERDWSNVIVGQLQATSSPKYARQGTRPVVTLWGLGFADRPYTAARAAELVDWFKAQGVFVVGGVPYTWRTDGSKPGYLDQVYPKLGLIQPWAVGAINDESQVAAHFDQYVSGDVAWTNQRGIRYQRVIFPGFAWSNWNGGAQNAIPRRGGRFFWAQASAVAQAHVGAYIAMFDEYDEGTAIAKAAENESMVPSNQYFLALNADGYDLSSDFYLRLAGAATRVIKGLDPVWKGVPVPPREGRAFGADTLPRDRTLAPGGQLISPNGAFVLTYQSDGNLVLYQTGGGPLWASNTGGTSPGSVAMQGDGNLVIYNSAGAALWASGTSGYPGARLVMQDDGNIVIYDSFDAPLWAIR